MYITDTLHLVGIKKVSDVIKNAQNRKFKKNHLSRFLPPLSSFRIITEPFAEG